MLMLIGTGTSLSVRAFRRGLGRLALLERGQDLGADFLEQLARIALGVLEVENHVIDPGIAQRFDELQRCARVSWCFICGWSPS
jgi:hypothetical protein